MEKQTRVREGKASSEKVYSRKEVDRMLKEKERALQVQYSVLKETYQQLLALKEDNEALKEKLLQYENPNDGYRKDWTWVRKIIFVLEKAGRPMRSAELIDKLSKREEHLRNHWNQAQYFSAFLNKALKEERIKREKRKGERGYYYNIQDV